VQQRRVLAEVTAEVPAQFVAVAGGEANFGEGDGDEGEGGHDS